MARTTRGGPGGRGELVLLLDELDEAYEKKAWHGPNLRGALRGVTPEAAAWRPGAGRHSIWELAVHAAYWKYAVRRRLTGERRGAFARVGSNWFARPDTASAAAWRDDLALLAEEHRRLRDAAARVAPAALHRPSAGSRRTVAEMLRGIALHDVYHAGQIQLLKRLGPGS